MATPALPFGVQYALGFIPRAVAARVIPEMWQPNFGIVPNAVIPGSCVSANAFYNPLIQYENLQTVPLPVGNMPNNLYLGFIPGISRAPMP